VSLQLRASLLNTQGGTNDEQFHVSPLRVTGSISVICACDTSVRMGEGGMRGLGEDRCPARYRAG
jgi:hypothetical protein